MSDKWYVISRSRGVVQLKDIKKLVKGNNVPAYDIKEFSNIEDARKYYYTGFFDDSDVGIFTLIKDKWHKYIEKYIIY